MAALATAITNLFEPAIWSQAFLELTTELSLLVQSGIAASDPALVEAANKGGRNVDMPFFDDLPHDLGTSTRSKVATDTDDEIVPAGMTSDKDLAVKNFRTQSFQTASIVKYVAGTDIVQQILARYAKWWQKEEQRLMLKILTGIFADATIATNLSNNIAGEEATTDPAKLIGTASIEDTRFLLGDAFQKLTGMVMHSTPFKRLRNLGLVDDVPAQDQNSEPFSTYQGLRVLVDDGMTKVAGSTSGFKYHTFLFGPGAFARVDVPLESGDPNIEVVREPKQGTGAGAVDVITRRYFLLHPRGIKYSGSYAGVSPSDAELEADNWTQVYQTKNIRIARLITNG